MTIPIVFLSPSVTRHATDGEGVAHATISNDKHHHYQAVMYTIFSMLGADSSAEQQTSNGRMDLAVNTQQHLYFRTEIQQKRPQAPQQIDLKNMLRRLPMTNVL